MSRLPSKHTHIDYNPHVLPDNEFIESINEEISRSYIKTIENLREEIRNLNWFTGELKKEIADLEKNLNDLDKENQVLRLELSNIRHTRNGI